MKTLEEAQERARSVVASDGEVSQLLSEASGKAQRSYEFLLSSWESLQTLIRMIRAWLGNEYAVPIATVVGGVAALIYFVDPFDLIPDYLPVFGYLDDAAVIAAVVRLNLSEVSRFRNWEAALGSRKLTGTE